MTDFNIDDQLKTLSKSPVVVQRATVTDGGYTNQSTTTWATHLTISGAIQTLSGNEVMKADKLGIKASHKLFCNVIDVTERDRILYNSKYYQITFVDRPMEVAPFLEIMLLRDDNYTANSS